MGFVPLPGEGSFMLLSGGGSCPWALGPFKELTWTKRVLGDPGGISQGHQQFSEALTRATRGDLSLYKVPLGALSSL